MHNLLHPTSVAVIGASSDSAKVGHAVLLNLLRGDFVGPVYPVNPEHRSVRGVRAYASVLDIPDAVDLAVVAVPAGNVDEVLDQGLDKGVRALVVLTSGSPRPVRRGSRPSGSWCPRRAHGMRVVGSNALGVANNDPAVQLNATLAPLLPGPGRVGFFAQSGALGIAILAAAAERGLGLSTFVSAGNRADLSGNDLLQYWQTDSSTDVWRSTWSRSATPASSRGSHGASLDGAGDPRRGHRAGPGSVAERPGGRGCRRHARRLRRRGGAGPGAGGRRRPRHRVRPAGGGAEHSVRTGVTRGGGRLRHPRSSRRSSPRRGCPPS